MAGDVGFRHDFDKALQTNGNCLELEMSLKRTCRGFKHQTFGS